MEEVVRGVCEGRWWSWRTGGTEGFEVLRVSALGFRLMQTRIALVDSPRTHLVGKPADDVHASYSVDADPGRLGRGDDA